ncbi:MAG: HEAT repeat domain-containing protein [Myxococcota bacterium]
MTTGPRKARLGTLAVALVVAVGCSGEEPEPAAPASPAPSRSEPQRSPAEEASSVPLPGPAGVELSVRGQRVTLACREADVGGILSDLADELEFALEVTGAPLPRLTARIVDAPIAEALPVVLAGVRYDAEFESQGDTHRLVRLRVGGVGDAAPGGTRASNATMDRIREAVERSRVTGSLLDPDDPRVAVDDADLEDEDEERAQAAWIDRLSDRDPAERARAAYEVEPEGRGLDALLGVLYNDADPSVRTAAVSQLEDSDAHAAVEGLVYALSDRDRGVVLEAIDALEFAGDESVIPSLEPLLDSPDAEVREAAEEAIEFLE